MPITPITSADPESRTPDLVAENIAKLKTLFPELITEGKEGASVNLDVLKALVGDKTLTDADEKYGLNWFGKRRARQLALTPSTGTLRPCPKDSEAWDTTKNLMIEGDNLEVLKLLQKSYANRVKLIYIDPPYNTGKDFVYPDDYQDNIRNYLSLTGQTGEDGAKLSTNTESSGRFHTDWLNMMYARLKLASNLLRNDGVVFVSIDDSEFARLKALLDEVFGEENLIAVFIWKSRQNKDNRTINGASIDHEYIVCYGKRIRGSNRDLSQYANPDGDSRGDWSSANMVGIATADRRPNLHYNLVNPETGIDYGCPYMGWRYDKKSMARLINEKKIIWPPNVDGRPRRKLFLSELDGLPGYSTVIGDDVYTRDGTADLGGLFVDRVFTFPKPMELLSELIQQATADDSIILDFFAGSGTTGHAVMAQNAADGGNRRYILVQLPEPLDPENKDQKTAANFCDSIKKPRTIAEITKERLRRAAKKIRDDNPMFAGDLGFRVFKLDSSNIKEWDPHAQDLAKTLEEHVQNLKQDRSEDDILFELLLKLGIDLSTPIEERNIAGHAVHAIGVGTLVACLSKSFPDADAEPVAQGIIEWLKELAPKAEDKRARQTTIVFRDSAFESDVGKTNLAAILNQHGIENVRSI
jgi:adenine-specific DNA-methyltransferase